MVRGLENIYTDEAAQAVPEIFKENIAAFGNKQVFDMVRVALDMLEDVAEKAYGELREKFGSRTDITLVKGDQPVYYFILSVE